MADGEASSPQAPPFARVAIVGCGLIGGSIALAGRRAGVHFALHDQDRDALARAEALGLGDSYHAGIADAVSGADCVIACVPVGASEAVARAIAPHLKSGAVVSDAGSVKRVVVEAMAPHMPPGIALVPAHPIAGTEQSGPDAAFATLFRNRWCILTPPEGTDAGAVSCLTAFWEGLGANVETMDAAHHDRVLAITSHLPHLIAYNIVGTVSDLEGHTKSEVLKFSASGFRDFTRIAASDPTMWRDVFLSNQDAVLEMLGRFSEDLALLQRAIRWGDGDQLFELFTRTRDIRRRIVEAGQDTDAADFGRHAAEETR
ncbi:MAG: prephenate/arogenate dehydrogenase family protein [Pseudomonadota bacterium]